MSSTPGTAAQIPDATIARLPGYLRVLRQLTESGVETVSSNDLADACHVQPALLRRDLSHFGSYGTRGVGYEVGRLMAEIEAHVGTASTTWPVVIVGVGNLGRALAQHGGMTERGFRLVGLVDADPATIGTTVAGLVVTPQDDLEEMLQRTGARIAVVATPASAAQQMVDRLVASGIRSILNFAPTALHTPVGVTVRGVDLSQELQILAFHETHRSEQSQ